MARPGPPPTPTTILKLHGSREANARRNEPEVAPAKVTCPSWLSARGKMAWREIERELGEVRIIGKLDRSALTLLCDTWARWRDAREFIEKNGRTYESHGRAGTQIKPFPEVAIESDCAKRLHRLFLEFGMTPSARTRIEVTDKDQPTSGKKRFFGNTA